MRDARRIVAVGLESPSPARAEIARLVRARARAHVCDESGTDSRGDAIYTLSDPREIRTVRYVGRTRAPRRRFLQHARAASLFIPEGLPWWAGEERYRPLYEWMRALYRDGGRLPMMIVTAWHAAAADAAFAERALIQDALRSGMPLLNVESATLDPQLSLI